MAWYEIAVLVFGGLGGLGGIAALINARHAARKTDVDALTTTIATLQTENGRLCNRLLSVEADLATEKKQREALEQALEAANGRQAELQAQLEQANERIRVLEAEREQLKAQLTKRRTRAT